MQHIPHLVFQHATVQSLPSLRRIVQDLMFEPPRQDPSSLGDPRQYTPSTPAERYIHLLCEDKIAILAFLCEICIASRVIRAHIDWADASLTELRKEKIEVNREKRRLYVS
jgi:bromodomain adjacent to zinc finger domain protein 1A